MFPAPLPHPRLCVELSRGVWSRARAAASAAGLWGRVMGLGRPSVLEGDLSSPGSSPSSAWGLLASGSVVPSLLPLLLEE